MARDDNDMTGELAATETESRSSATARKRALGENPFTPEQMAEAIAKAQERVRQDEAKAREKPLPDVVRASVRCGTETIKQDGKVIIRPASMTFGPSETADGSTVTVQDGRPVRLKREAFLRHRRDGKVQIAQ